MYHTCLRCNRSLGANAEIAHLPVGRRIAFDTQRGRLWVICTRCGQWNLTPLEERWEALEECERLAGKAEARGGGTTAALAQTESGLELLRVGGMSDADIANWRYGGRIDERRKRQRLTLLPLFGVAIGLGLAAWRGSGVALMGAWVTALAGFSLYFLWFNRPRLWRRFTDSDGQRRVLWPWQLQRVRIEWNAEKSRPPVVVVPRMSGDLRLQGVRAVSVLASLLPGLNGADCADVHLQSVVELVAHAEGASRRGPRRLGRAARRRARARHAEPPPAVALRPWEHLVHDVQFLNVVDAAPMRRLALEMAVTEELEQQQLTERSVTLAEEWRDEEEIGAISDDLLLPDDVRKRLDELRRK